MKIALDVMGGDFAPESIIDGGILAINEDSEIKVVLVGRENLIKQYLNKKKFPKESIEIVNADEVIEMAEAPSKAVKTKKNSSISVMNELHKKGEVDAVISMGNTGACMAISLFTLGRIKGVLRPTIGAFMPCQKGMTLIIDVGAVTECKPENLYQFAVMGSIYYELIMGIKNPTVGLLSIGEEEEKGTELTKETLQLLKKSKLNFIGYVEGRDILKGVSNIVVCDGFVGNIVLKFAESVMPFISQKLREKIDTPLTKLGGMLIRPVFRELKSDLDPEEYGGVPLLGLNGISIIGHGSSTSKSVKNSIFVAKRMINAKLNLKIAEALAE
ncbi:phosphate acyltransferase PlsX [bacterium]|nr:phosphate acyltransferase PlsX [bacterium]